jgi:hypothetical protein
MVQANITLLLPAALTQDINTLWLRSYTGPMTTLANPAAAADTTLTLTKPPVQPLLGETILVDGEPMIVTAISADSLTLTVTRYLTAFPFMGMLPIQPSGAHAAGAPVYLLTYETPWVWIAEPSSVPGYRPTWPASAATRYLSGRSPRVHSRSTRRRRARAADPRLPSSLFLAGVPRSGHVDLRTSL